MKHLLFGNFLIILKIFMQKIGQNRGDICKMFNRYSYIIIYEGKIVKGNFFEI